MQSNNNTSTTLSSTSPTTRAKKPWTLPKSNNLPQKVVYGIYHLGQLVYIGQTSNYYCRKRNHLSKLKYNTHPNKNLQSLYNKDNNPSNYTFIILKDCTNITEERKTIEERLISLLNPTTNIYSKCV